MSRALRRYCLFQIAAIFSASVGALDFVRSSLDGSTKLSPECRVSVHRAVYSQLRIAAINNHVVVIVGAFLCERDKSIPTKHVCTRRCRVQRQTCRVKQLQCAAADLRCDAVAVLQSQLQLSYCLFRSHPNVYLHLRYPPLPRCLCLWLWRCCDVLALVLL